MNLEMKGKLVKVLESQKGISKAGKEWVKQSFVLDNGAKYNPEVSFNLFGQEKVDQMISTQKQAIKYYSIYLVENTTATIIQVLMYGKWKKMKLVVMLLMKNLLVVHLLICHFNIKKKERKLIFPFFLLYLLE